MAVVKISDKKLLDDIQARLVLRLGRKISQQEIIDLCVRYASENLDIILRLASIQPQLTPEKAEIIIQRIEKRKNIPYNKHAKFPNPEDEEIYSL